MQSLVSLASVHLENGFVIIGGHEIEDKERPNLNHKVGPLLHFVLQ